jgi:AcrR family transcriptional regulator
MDMSSVATLSSKELDARARIVETAEALFRDIGYQKTTVADIAKALKMSPANVYRFFDSKKSINEAVAERITAEVRARMTAVARSDRLASERLRDLLRTMNACMCELGASEAKMHDMVEAAMNESWGVIRAHIDQVDEIITGVVADGVTSGEFDADPKTAGPCIRAAMIRFCHPAIIAQCHNMLLPTLEQQIEFVLAAVRAR